MMQIAAERFEELVGEALDAIPDALGRLIDNVVVLVEDHPPEPGVLGLYEGIPLTERQDYGAFAMPDRVTVYRLPLCAMCDSEAELVEEVGVTVVHEIAHHFGIDDDELHRLGWG